MKKKAALIGFFILACFFGLWAGIDDFSNDPVDWKILAPFLSEIEGWQIRGKIQGEMNVIDSHKISQAEGTYIAGNKTMTVQITDAGNAPMLLGSLKMMMNIDVENPAEVAKKVWVNGYPGLNKHRIPEREGEVILLVVDRFIVTMKSSNITDMEELLAAAQELDLPGIAALAVIKNDSVV